MDCPDRWAEAVAAKSSEVSVMATGIISLLIGMFMVTFLIGFQNKSALLTMEFNVPDLEIIQILGGLKAAPTWHDLKSRVEHDHGGGKLSKNPPRRHRPWPYRFRSSPQEMLHRP